MSSYRQFVKETFPTLQGTAPQRMKEVARLWREKKGGGESAKAPAAEEPTPMDTDPDEPGPPPKKKRVSKAKGPSKKAARKTATPVKKRKKATQRGRGLKEARRVRLRRGPDTRYLGPGKRGPTVHSEAAAIIRAKRKAAQREQAGGQMVFEEPLKEPDTYRKLVRPLPHEQTGGGAIGSIFGSMIGNSLDRQMGGKYGVSTPFPLAGQIAGMAI